MKKLITLALIAVLALGVVPAFATVGDYVSNGTSVDTDGTAFDFTTSRQFVWMKNDSTTISCYVVFFKKGEAVPATLSTGGLEIKPGESFYRESKGGGLEFQGVVLYSASSTVSVRVFAGAN